MSKLFDTLEKIRENESYQPHDLTKKAVKKATVPRKFVLAGISLAVVVLIALVLFSDFLFTSGPTSTSQPQPTASIDVEQQAVPLSTPKSSKKAIPAYSLEKSRIYTLANLQQWEKDLAAESDQSTRQIILLNNIATYYIYHQQYWKGLSFLDQALKVQPRSIEMLINYAVALTEMGLYGAAAKHFTQAHNVDPRHPALLENLELIKKAKIMDGQLASLYKRKK